MDLIKHVPDLVNAGFEAAGAFFAWMNVKKIRTDKSVAGVYWFATVCFAAWGYWNMFYYPWLGQWFSALAGAVLAVGNSVWVYHAVKCATRSPQV